MHECREAQKEISEVQVLEYALQSNKYEKAIQASKHVEKTNESLAQRPIHPVSTDSAKAGSDPDAAADLSSPSEKKGAKQRTRGANGPTMSVAEVR